MLFNVSERDFFEDNPHVRIMPEFAGANSAQLKFVALFSDWLSPYRKLSQQERRERALMAAGGYVSKGGQFSKEGTAIMAGKNKEVEGYIEMYKKIQGISSEEQSLDAIKMGEKTIRDRLNSLDETTPAKDIGDLAKSLTMLAKERRILEDLIDEKLGVNMMRALNGDDEELEEDSAWERRIK